MHGMEHVAYATFDRLRRIKRRIRPNRDEEYERIVADPTGMAQRYYARNLDYALRHVPYYRNLHGDLKKPSLLTKSVIREYFDDLKSDRITDLAGLRENTSGGSTGVPVRFLQDSEYDRHVGYAMTYYFEHIIGFEWGSLRKLMIWGSEKDLLSWSGDWRKRLQGVRRNIKYVNSFSLSETGLANCVNTINSYRPEMIRGYASSLLAVAQYIKRSNAQVHPPRFLVNSAETLTTEARSVIEDVFDRPLYDFYGSRECGAIAGQCRSGLMHVFSFNHHIEIVGKDNIEVAPGEEGRILVTTLHNRAMPLMRFEIGDLAVNGGAACNCGCDLPTLEKIQGRISDNFITRDGTIVHAEYFTHLFYFRDWVKEFQVIQKDYDLIQVNFALNDHKKLSAHEQADIEGKIRVAMGADCKIEFRRVDEIPRSPQGKFLFTFSEVSHGK